MGFFKCCKDCTKRHPTCHGECPDYKEEKKQYEEYKEAKRKDAPVRRAKTDYLNDAVWHKKRKY